MPEVPLVGRAHELDEVRRWLTRALGSEDADDIDRLLVVSGPGGIGKTRLVSELLGSTPDLPVGRGGAHLGASQVPLLPWADALRMLARGIGRPAIEEAAGEVAQELAPLLPELRRGDWSSAGATADLLPWFLGRLSEREPIVIVLEDLHLTDLTTLSTLPRVVQQVRGRFALVVTARPEGDPRDPDAAQRWADSLARLRRVPGVRVLPLGPLSSAEAARLATLLGGEAFDRQVARDIATRSEGVPFFVEELSQAARSGVAGHRLHTDVLGARLHDLDHETTAVVRAVAIHGVSIRHDELAELTALYDASLFPAIHAAVAAGALVAGDDDDYRLRHTLVGEALRAQMLPVERRELHAACARSLTARVDAAQAKGDVVPARTIAALAMHWDAAAQADRALTAALRAAAAVASVAPLEASRHFAHAAELFVKVDGAQEHAAATLAEILESAATYAASAGEAAPASSLLAVHSKWQSRATPAADRGCIGFGPSTARASWPRTRSLPSSKVRSPPPLKVRSPPSLPMPWPASHGTGCCLTATPRRSRLRNVRSRPPAGSTPWQRPRSPKPYWARPCAISGGTPKDCRRCTMP